jgi:hypothetical protein
MDRPLSERRRLLALLAFAAFAAPAVVLAGCASRGTRPPKFRTGGGNRSGDKGNGGGFGGGGNR